MQDLHFLWSVVPHRVAGPPQCPAAHASRTVAEFQLRRAVCVLRKDCDKQRIIRHLAAKVNQRAGTGGIYGSQSQEQDTRPKPKSKGRKAAKAQAARRAKARPKAAARSQRRSSQAAESPARPQARRRPDHARPRRSRKARPRHGRPCQTTRPKARQIAKGRTAPKLAAEGQTASAHASAEASPRRERSRGPARSEPPGPVRRRTPGTRQRPAPLSGAAQDRMISAAKRSRRIESGARRHTETSPTLTAGDVDAQVAGRVRGRRRSARRRQPDAGSGSRGRHRQGARHSVSGRSGTAGRRRSRRARPASLGARPGVVRRLAARQEGRRARSAGESPSSSDDGHHARDDVVDRNARRVDVDRVVGSRER